jgi:hypothetical protein
LDFQIQTLLTFSLGNARWGHSRFASGLETAMNRVASLLKPPKSDGFILHWGAACEATATMAARNGPAKASASILALGRTLPPFAWCFGGLLFLF